MALIKIFDIGKITMRISRMAINMILDNRVHESKREDGKRRRYINQRPYTKVNTYTHTYTQPKGCGQEYLNGKYS